MPSNYAMIAAAAGAASAFVYASLLLGTPAAFILAYLAQLPLYAVGLWLGSGAGIIASGAGIVVAFLAGGFAFGVIYTLANTAPVLLIVRQALQWRTAPNGNIEWYPPGGLLMSLVGLASALFAILVVVFSAEPGGLEGTIEAFLNEGLKRLSGPLGMDAAMVEQFADQMARFFPGIIAVSWLTMSAVNAILAQGLLSRFKRNWRPSPRMADIDLPIWLSGLTAIFAIGAFLEGLGGFVSSNMLVLFAAAYSFAGLSVVHALIGKLQWRGAALGALYGAILVFGWPIAVVAVLGLIEPYANLKARAAGAPRRPPAASLNPILTEYEGDKAMSQMDVILLQRIEALGQMGDVVKVKPGYARNFLLPTKKALRATKENLAYFEKQRVQLEAQNLKQRADAQAVGEKMGENFSVVIIRTAGESGMLYGSVSSRDIAVAMKDAGVTVDRTQVLLAQPIKALGLFKTRVALHPEVSVTITVNVAQSAEEAKLQAEGKASKPQAEAAPPAELTAPAEEAPAVEAEAEPEEKPAKKAKKKAKDEA